MLRHSFLSFSLQITVSGYSLARSGFLRRKEQKAKDDKHVFIEDPILLTISSLTTRRQTTVVLQLLTGELNIPGATGSGKQDLLDTSKTQGIIGTHTHE